MRVNLIYNFYMSDSFDGVDRSRLVMVNKFFIILLSLFWGIGCNSSVVVPEDLVVSDVTTGWLDVGFDELGREIGRLGNNPDTSFRTVLARDGARNRAFGGPA